MACGYRREIKPLKLSRKHILRIQPLTSTKLVRRTLGLFYLSRSVINLYIVYVHGLDFNYAQLTIYSCSHAPDVSLSSILLQSLHLLCCGRSIFELAVLNLENTYNPSDIFGLQSCRLCVPESATFVYPLAVSLKATLSSTSSDYFAFDRHMEINPERSTSGPWVLGTSCGERAVGAELSDCSSESNNGLKGDANLPQLRWLPVFGRRIRCTLGQSE